MVEPQPGQRQDPVGSCANDCSNPGQVRWHKGSGAPELALDLLAPRSFLHRDNKGATKWCFFVAGNL